MAYVTAEARQDLLREIAGAIDVLAQALAALGAAYELLDEHAADTLEEQLFRSVQVAYGRAQRTHASFAQRYSLRGRAFAPPRNVGGGSATATDLVDSAVERVEEADTMLADLQDSMRPVEVGDPELRAGMAEVRTLLGDVPGKARRLQSVLGR